MGRKPKREENATPVIKKTEPGSLFSLLTGGHQPIFLIGAGASVKSGVPAAGEFAERAIRWAWCLEHGRSPEDPLVMRSDWWPWAQGKLWFDHSKPLAEQYPVVIEELFGVKERRREFLSRMISPDIPPSAGYDALARLLHDGWLTTILTTNFDNRLDEARIRQGRPHSLTIIRTPDDYIRFNTSPKFPQLVHLHGSVEHYSDKNLIQEVASLDPKLVKLLTPALRDHPLVIIGYRGAEPSIMRDLLLGQVKGANSFLHGVYWCVRSESGADGLHPLVKEFTAKIGHNFQLVEIGGFDELMNDQLLRPLVERGVTPPKQKSSLPAVQASFDMGACENTSVKQLDLALLGQRLKQYSSQLGLNAPENPSEKWALEEAAKRHLVVERKGQAPIPTNAGWLLFAHRPSEASVSGRILFKAHGPAGWLRRCFGSDAVAADVSDEAEATVEREVGGNLWAQLDTLYDMLALVNRGFRLKEEQSRTAYPYHPIALKEVVVNALVHRDYCVNEPIIISVGPHRIAARSPGGITAEVKAQTMSKPLEELIREGKRGIKGYRNPVISDLFYGGGQMDRAGSGLSDVLRLTVENGGRANFGPTDNNDAFVVELFSRPEAVDEITNTAPSMQVEVIRYAANLLEFSTLPGSVWHAGTPHKSKRAAYAALGSGLLPPCYIYDRRLYSLFDLSVLDNSDQEIVDEGDVEHLSLREFLALPNGENSFVHLINLAVRAHAESCGLIVDKKGKMYFPRTELGERAITYQGRVRRATRTVVKARNKRDSTEILYWEHKACSFQAYRFGDTWALALNPAYAFTTDGYRDSLRGARLNRLSTKRAARDFNQNVHQDLVFWCGVLSRGSDESFQLDQSARAPQFEMPQIWLSPRLPTTITSTAHGSDGQEFDDEVPAADDLAEEIEHLVLEGGVSDDD